MAQKEKTLQEVPVWVPPHGQRNSTGLLGGAQELTPSFVCVCLPGGKSDAGHFPPGENTTIRGSTELGGNVPWGRGWGGEPGLHVLKRAEQRSDVKVRHEAELMGQIFGSSADTRTAGKGRVCRRSSRILF